MNPIFESIWPSDVPWSYWNLDKLEPSSVGARANFMGLNFSYEFLFAATVGLFAIWFFATKTFNRPSFEADEMSFRVLQQVEPSELRNRSLVRRSYILYAGSLIAIFLALTFFGSIIIRLINVIPNPAGLQVDVGAINFESPQWPITIALGMIGLIPMLKPVEAAERLLRKWAHKRAGIPVKIHQQVAEIRAELEALDMPERNVPSWIGDEVRDSKDIKRTLEAAAQLERLRHWLKDEEAYWPDASERAPLRLHEREEIAASEISLEEFYALLAQPQPTTGKGAKGEEESVLAHRNRLLNKWMSLSDELQSHRNELVALLVVYAERDHDYDEIEDAELEGVIKRVFDRPKPTQGPEFGLGWMVWLAFPIYAAAVAMGLHPLFGNVDGTLVNVLVTAGLETLKLALLFWLPIAMVMGYRYAKIDEGSWKPMTLFRFRREVGQQMFRVVILSLIVPILTLLLLGLLWAVTIAPNANRLRELYLLGNFPYALVFPTLVAIPFVFSLLIISNVDSEGAQDRIWNSLPRWGWGLIAAALTAVAMYIHFFLWVSSAFGTTTWELCSSSSVKQCAYAYSAINFIVYPGIVFLSFNWLMPDRKRAIVKRRTRSKRRLVASVSTTAALLAGGLILFSTPLDAQNDNLPFFEPPSRIGTKTIRVGFRADAEPFSYRIKRKGEDRYTGFVADLCHKIFDGSIYVVEAVEVTAQNRFEILRPMPSTPGRVDKALPLSKLDNDDAELQNVSTQSEDEAQKALGDSSNHTHKIRSLGGEYAALRTEDHIDVLCDPVTLRYSLNDGRSSGVFSPIVFVTGVSYMLRRTGRNDRITLALVGQVSAQEIAARLCRDDAFRLYTEERDRIADNLRDTCRVPGIDNYVEDPNHADVSEKGCTFGGTKEQRYQICAFRSHKDLISWFCSRRGENENRQRVYIGDQDIIEGKLAAWQRSGRDCGSNIERHKQVFTYEPYAIVVTKANPELIVHVQRRVYEIFSNRSEAMGLFTTHFPGKSLSVPLANLFLLNGVEQQTCLQVSHEDTCPTIVTPRLSAQN